MKITSQLLKPIVLTVTSLAASVVLCQSLPAQAVNLVQNGDFDSGSLSPWQGDGVELRENRGIIANHQSGRGYLEQTLLSPTTVGENYQLSFDLFFNSDSPNLFQAKVGDTIVFYQTNIPKPTQSFASFTRTFVGNGSDKLRFDFGKFEKTSDKLESYFAIGIGIGIGSRLFQLDNVVIDSVNNLAPTSVPEPFTILGSIIGGIAALRMKN